MTITAINTVQFVITALLLLVSFSLYAWKVRPYLKQRPEFHGLYVRADGFWARVRAWLKVRWDLAIAGILAAAPILWNGALDLIVALSLALADALPALAGIDLSALVIPDWVKTSIQVGGAVVPIVRAQLLARREA